MKNEIVEKFIKDDIVDDMVWSFSRLSSFHKCKRMWYLTYITKCEQRPNFFSDYGTFCHELFESYDKGEIECFEMIPIVEMKYNEGVPTTAPPNRYVDLNSSYKDKLIRFLDGFNGYDDETIGVEKDINIDFDYHGKIKKLTGYIDRVSKDNKGIIITDHKSRSRFKNEDEVNEYLRQLYLYSIGVKEIYGEYPHTLKFNMFKENMEEIRKFNMEQLEEAKKWVVDVIDDIYNEEEFECTRSDFFCKYICGVYEHCEVYDDIELPQGECL